MIDVYETLASKLLLVDILPDAETPAHYAKSIDKPVQLVDNTTIIEGTDFFVPMNCYADCATMDAHFKALFNDAIPQNNWRNTKFSAKNMQSGLEQALGYMRRYNGDKANLKVLCHPSAAISPNWGFEIIRDERMLEDEAYFAVDTFPPGVLVVRKDEDGDEFGMAIIDVDFVGKVAVK